MKKIEVIEDIRFIGVPTLKAGTQFKVEKFNSRFVYVRYFNYSLRLSRKQVKTIY